MVLRAETAPSGAATVLKCLLSPFSPEEEDAFKSEFLFLEAVGHPYWVRAGTFGRLPEEGYYFTLEEARGEPLSAFPTHGWTPEVLEVARKLLSGLDALHRLGVAHLDLHPEQILVDSGAAGESDWGEHDFDGLSERLDLRMLDLGLAARFGEAIPPRGTLGYMAPEIISREAHWDGRADLYAFGVILHELLLGRSPFPGNTPREILRAQLDGFEWVDPGGAYLPPRLPELFQDLLDPSPRSRPQSAWEVWNRLRAMVPQRVATDLPRQLTGSPRFTFVGREAEIDAFLRWADRPSTSEHRTCRITGEPGIGKRRLAARLAAVAQTEGWELCSATEAEWVLRGGSRRTSLLIKSTVSTGRLPSRTEIQRELADELTIDLGPLSPTLLIDLCQSRSLESMRLATRLAELSLGVPALLEAILGELPRQIDLGSRYPESRAAERFLQRVPVPQVWIEWLRSAMSSMPEEVRETLIRIALVDSRLDSDTDLLTSESLSGLVSRGLLDYEGGHPTIPEPWGRAVESVDPARTRGVARHLLSSHSDTSRPVELLETALRLGDVDIAGQVFESALQDLHDRSRYEEELELFGRGWSLGVRVTRLEAILRQFLDTVFSLGYPPEEWLPALTVPPQVHSSAAYRIYCAWRRVALKDFEGALDGLSELRTETTKDARVSFASLYVRKLALVALGREEQALDEVEELWASGGFGDSELDALLQVVRIDLTAANNQLDQSREALAALDSQVSHLRHVDLGLYHLHAGVVAFRRGEIEKAKSDFELAERVTREHGLHTNHLLALNNLGGIAYQQGDLRRAQDWGTQVFYRWLEQERWVHCVMSLSNLGLIALQRGRLGAAVETVRSGWSFASRASARESIQEARFILAHVMMRVGLVHYALDLVDQGFNETDDDRKAFLQALAGEGAFALRDEITGRKLLRESVETSQQDGASDDAAEQLVTWISLEVDVGAQQEALELYDELDTLHESASALTRAQVVLAEAEMASLGWLEVEGLEQVDGLLRNASALLEEKDLGYFEWRVHWRRGQVLDRAGLYAEAGRAYSEARTRLMALTESLSEEQHQEAFLKLPAPQQFLRDLESRGRFDFVDQPELV